MATPRISGFGHIDLTVTDLERSIAWWERVLGFSCVFRRTTDEFSLANMYHPSGVPVSLMRHAEPASDRFDERAVGLDHFALRVPDPDALAAWAAHLDELGVEHSGVLDENGGPLIVFRDPDNIQLELWAYDPALVRLD
jgi:catechol 2,3-dioxygenase-like lactoylglutathione lyase family enzyme